MNKNTILAIVAVIVIGIGTYLFYGSKSEAPKMQENNVMQESSENTFPEGVMMEDGTVEEVVKTEMIEQDKMIKEGSYEAYSPDKLSLAESGKVVLFFRASWCPTCRGLDSDIKSNISNIPEGLHILDVDYDNSSDLKKKYGVTYQHTLVQVDSSGNQITKWSNSPTLASLLTKLK